ncbi:thiamine phosphate synthase [Paraflavitalea pollutisoli]|uniref:thiamine phosphate synthase n=1 Tax=Paraflavitalea pollutisoli TaxID=3034143 RepID=UPI0023EDEE4C|nr:thiamine phosphate synthase [Paraflavitalea sp. H1-2-19X]
MSNKRRKINGGLYLVVDPATGEDYLLPALRSAMEGGVDIVQIWDHWLHGQDKRSLVSKICALAHQHDLPVLINEDWSLAQDTQLDGVHFDEPPADLASIRALVGRDLLIGITCGNDLEKVTWAESNQLDYISFCSMFPSTSAGTCELVTIETVQAARRITALPIFLAGGITLDNLPGLVATPMNGIAVISGIMRAADPAKASAAYKQTLVQQLKQR